MPKTTGRQGIEGAWFRCNSKNVEDGRPPTQPPRGGRWRNEKSTSQCTSHSVLTSTITSRPKAIAALFSAGTTPTQAAVLPRNRAMGSNQWPTDDQIPAGFAPRRGKGAKALKNTGCSIDVYVWTRSAA